MKNKWVFPIIIMCFTKKNLLDPVHSDICGVLCILFILLRIIQGDFAEKFSCWKAKIKPLLHFSLFTLLWPPKHVEGENAWVQTMGEFRKFCEVHWLKDMIEHYVRGWAVHRYISLMAFKKRLLKLHCNFKKRPPWGGKEPHTTIYTSLAVIHLCTLDMSLGINFMESPWQASSLDMARKVKWAIGYCDFS